MVYLILIVVFLLLIIASGEVFIRGAIGIASRLRISSFAIGASILAVGTASPDFFVSGASVLKGHAEVSLGSVIGSVIVNILVCIGLASIISGVRYDKKDKGLSFGMKYHLLFLIIMTTSLMFSNGEIGWGLSLFLVISAGFFLFCTLTMEAFQLEDEDGAGETASINLPLSLGFFGAGIIGLSIFSNYLLDAIINASEFFKIPKKVISSLMIGFGNSIPEIVTAVIASLKKRSRVIIGNVIGSNILILGGVLGASSFLANIMGSKIQVSLPILTLDLPFLMLCTVLFFFFFKIKNHLGRILGLIFIFLYLLYILLQINII
jgi:cation:H+ antiporter